VPIYEYRCTKCGKTFEAFQKVTDEPINECKFCNAVVEKLISHSSFQLKGSGWYVTDYTKRSDSSAKDAAKSDDSSKATETKPLPSVQNETGPGNKT